MTTTTEHIEIQVDSREVLDERLEDAVRGLQQIAMATGTQGILLTRTRLVILNWPTGVLLYSPVPTGYRLKNRP